MKLMSKAEVAHLLGSEKDVWQLATLQTSHGETAVQYLLPKESSQQTILAKFLAEMLCSDRGCWVEITYWHADSDANQDLFYGYRVGRGDTRSLQDASVYNFSPQDVEQFISVVSMVLYFSWDARIIDSAETCSINISHDEAIDCAAQSSVAIEQIVAEFSRLGMRPLT